MILLLRNWTGIDDVNYSILCSLSLLEVFLQLVNVVLFIAAVYTAIRAPFHWNLRILITVVVTQNYISALSRMFLLLFQVGLVHVEGAFETNRFVLFCAFCRCYYISVVCIGLGNISIERCIATVLVNDYEKKSRRYIGLSLSIITIISAVLVTPIAVYEFIPWIGFGALVGSISVIGPAFFVVLLNKNQLRYRRLCEHQRIMDTASAMEYTLSIRFQLNENVRTMKLIRNVIIMCGCGNVLLFVLYCGVRIDCLHYYSDVAAHYYDAAFNIVLALYATLVPVTAYVSDDIYRSIAKTIPVFGRFVRLKSTNCSVEDRTSNEAELYFESLQQQWNMPITRAKTES